MKIKNIFSILFLIPLFLYFVSCTITVTPPEKTKNESNNKQPPVTEEQTTNSEYKPDPNAIADTSVIKLNRNNLTNENNTNNMYLMLRFMGKSEKGFWQKIIDIENEIVAYPRGFVLDYIGIDESTVLNFNNENEGNQQLAGYDTFSGFSKVGGGVLRTNFYYGDNNMVVNINHQNDITFTFANFAIWDPTIKGEFMQDAHPDFVRYPNNKFKIKIPMKDYNPSVHKNIAYITVYFEPDKGTTDNLFPYVAVFDGFEPKTLP